MSTATVTVDAPCRRDFVPGLEGVVAFHTAIAEPDRDGGSLRYRGVDIDDLVGRVGFDDVWALLVDDEFGARCRATAVPAAVHSGDVRVDVQAGLALLGAAPGAAAAAGHHRRAGPRPPRAEHGGGAVLRRPLRARRRPAGRAARTSSTAVDDHRRAVPDRLARRADPEQVRAIDAYWVSAAEHGLNASTFTARVVASTAADVPAGITGAIGAMSGPLHGGAPARVLPMVQEVEATGDPFGLVTGILDRNERLMGFGHRVYRAEDPRARVLRRTCRDWTRRATRRPPRWSRPRWPCCASAGRTGRSRPTSSSGPR